MKTKFNLLSSALCLVMVLLGNLSAWAADIAVTGTVTDQSEEPLIGVSVTVKGRSGVGTTTDLDGNFSVKVPDGSRIFIYRIRHERTKGSSLYESCPRRR